MLHKLTKFSTCISFCKNLYKSLTNEIGHQLISIQPVVHELNICKDKVEEAFSKLETGKSSSSGNIPPEVIFGNKQFGIQLYLELCHKKWRSCLPKIGEN